jgi:uncharacterized protein YqjF (DUF2071 family)
VSHPHAPDASAIDERPFLTAEWRDLVMASYAVDPAVLSPLVPVGTDLDVWGGTTWISLVAFQFRDTRLLGMRVPFHGTFEEINLRFYVRRGAVEDRRRGVVFVREVVPRHAVAFLARRAYREPYVTMPTRSTIDAPGAGRDGRFEYGWKTPGGWCGLAATVRGDPGPPAAGSIEEFITEHYWGYNRWDDETSVEYRVAHRRWDVWLATDFSVVGDPASFYGPRFAPYLREAPRSVLVAAGSPVVVYRGRPIGGRSRSRDLDRTSIRMKGDL